MIFDEMTDYWTNN